MQSSQGAYSEEQTAPPSEAELPREASANLSNIFILSMLLRKLQSHTLLTLPGTVCLLANPKVLSLNGTAHSSRPVFLKQVTPSLSDLSPWANTTLSHLKCSLPSSTLKMHVTRLQTHSEFSQGSSANKAKQLIHKAPRVFCLGQS